VNILQDKEFIVVQMKFNKEKQIEILKAAGYPTDKSAKIKEKRKLLFGDVVTAQNFVF
jgi:hypothetical protein